MRNSRRDGGFTLIELIVVVAIMAILLSIAIPAYQKYVLKSKVRVAQTDLAALAVNVENHLQRKLAYHPDDESGTGLTDTFTGWSPSVGADFDYSYVADTPADGYTLKAAWKAASDEDLRGCEISLDSTNAKSMTEACVPVTGSTTW